MVSNFLGLTIMEALSSSLVIRVDLVLAFRINSIPRLANILNILLELRLLLLPHFLQILADFFS